MRYQLGIEEERTEGVIDAIKQYTCASLWGFSSKVCVQMLIVTAGHNSNNQSLLLLLQPFTGHIKTVSMFSTSNRAVLMLST